jgi:glucose/arabinose dehydrogenase
MPSCPEPVRATPGARRPRGGALAPLGLLAVALLAACGGGGGGTADVPAPAPAPAPATSGPAPMCTSSGSSSVSTTTVATGLDGIWSFVFLPDGRLLVALRGGTLRIVSADGRVQTPVQWDAAARPDIRVGGQGGLLDLALDPDFATSPWVYMAYQEPGPGGTSGTAVGRARLSGTQLTGFERLLQQVPKLAQDGVHFGARLAFRPDRTLLVSLGDRGQDDPANPGLNHAQSLATTLGKVVRIQRDGSVPADNPFVGVAGARPEIWSLGHRNPQGLTVSPLDGTVYSTEHGPQGGDELNRVAPASNYGWPLRSYGCPYGSTVGTACQVNGGEHAPLNGRSFVEPLVWWGPTSTAPSNLIVHDGRGAADWRGQLFVGALAGQRLWRIALDSRGAFASCEALLGGLNQRIRDVRQGPDGAIWVATDGGQVVRVTR